MTQGLPSLKIAAGLWALHVNGAEPGRGIQGHTGAVALLVHAGHAVAIGDQVIGHDVRRTKLDHEMTAQAAAGTGGEMVCRFGHRPRMHKRWGVAMGEWPEGDSPAL
jgi:hypothetical protein